jgi:hypothetical protein
MPHLADLEIAIHEQGEWMDAPVGGIADSLGVWIVTVSRVVPPSRKEVEKHLDVMVWNSFKRSFNSSLGEPNEQ